MRREKRKLLTLIVTWYAWFLYEQQEKIYIFHLKLLIQKRQANISINIRVMHERLLNCFKKDDVPLGIELEQGRDKEWWEVEPGQWGWSLDLYYHSNTCSICTVHSINVTLRLTIIVGACNESLERFITHRGTCPACGWRQRKNPNPRQFTSVLWYFTSPRKHKAPLNTEVFVLCSTVNLYDPAHAQKGICTRLLWKKYSQL